MIYDIRLMVKSSGVAGFMNQDGQDGPGPQPMTTT